MSIPNIDNMTDDELEKLIESIKNTDPASYMGDLETLVGATLVGAAGIVDYIDLGGPGSGHHGHKGVKGQRGGSAKSYIQAVEGHERVMRNPFNDRALAFINDAGDEVEADVELQEGWEFHGHETVYFNIHVPTTSRGKGYGTKTINKLKALADEHKIILQGEPSPFGNGKKMTLSQLKKWYKKLGFITLNEPGWYNKIAYIPEGLDVDLQAQNIDEAVLWMQIKTFIAGHDLGGEGSGNHGHAGRPGLRGGSLPTGRETDNYSARLHSFLTKNIGDKAVVDQTLKAIHEVRDWGVENDRENLIVVTEDGSLAGRYYGGARYVDMDKQDLPELHLTIHNHPNNSTFSKEDISTVMWYKHKYMVVVGHNGDVFIIKATPKTEEMANMSVTRDGLLKRLRSEEDLQITRTMPLYERLAELTPDDTGPAKRIAYKKAMEGVVETFGFEYDFFKTNGGEDAEREVQNR